MEASAGKDRFRDQDAFDGIDHLGHLEIDGDRRQGIGIDPRQPLLLAQELDAFADR